MIKGRLDAEEAATGRAFHYNRVLGRWWYGRANDAAHSRAYRKIADYIHASYARSPGLVVDYACGAGHLLGHLSARFRHSHFVGLDGSSFLLDFARQRLARLGGHGLERIQLVETRLPNYDLLCGRAGLVVFSFPNMIPFSDDDDLQMNESRLERNDLAVARSLAEASDPEDNDRSCDPEAIRFSLVQSRLVSLNLRRMLVQGGICVRVEYGKARRHELPYLDLLRVSYEEGSLDERIDGNLSHHWFRVVASSYFRSRVVEDVYQQTAKREDLEGGYLITVLRAL